MYRVILIVIALLLAVSLAGDVFFVHHHMSNDSLETEHTIPQYASCFLGGFADALRTHGSLLFIAAVNRSSSGADKYTGCFYGWYSSAYLDATASSVYYG